jgi:hypothetical protein
MRTWRNNGEDIMRISKVRQAVNAFNRLEMAQKKWDELFNELSEQEEAELEKRLFAQGITVSKSQSVCMEKKEVKQ